jgi:hypothetical protein
LEVHPATPGEEKFGGNFGSLPSHSGEEKFPLCGECVGSLEQPGMFEDICQGVISKNHYLITHEPKIMNGNYFSEGQLIYITFCYSGA